MPLTAAHVMLMDMALDRIITFSTTMKKIPGMTEEEAKAEIAKWEKMSDDEMDRLDSH